MIEGYITQNCGSWLAISHGVVFFVVCLFVIIELRRFFIFLRNKIWHWPVKHEAVQNRELYSELVSLRALTNSDRAYISRFHNGTEFLPSQPAWKTSRTHEVARKGVTYESANRQSMLVSLIPNLIDPILTGGDVARGITVPGCDGCASQSRCIVENKRVVIVQVDEMESSYCKYHLEAQNIKTAIYCGIAFDGNVCGIVGLDFCGPKLSDAMALLASRKACLATENIHYILNKKYS